jgi:predicted signal transduction protein with EAL and GGDEF domain
MKPGSLMLASPPRAVVMAGALVLALIVTWLHLQTGLAYEFHFFFGLPVLGAVWFAGSRPGIVVAIVVVALWLVADFQLGGAQADTLPLLFNSAIRLSLFVVGAVLLAHPRRLLVRESRLAREDALTGLANRREFLERGAHTLALAARQNMAATAVFIDLDYFKEVNDSLATRLATPC